MVTLIVGIDPGKGGGLAALATDGTMVRASAMPESDRELYEWLRDVRPPVAGRSAITVRAFLEKVWATPQMGRSSAFVFGQQFGRVRMALSAAGIPFDYVASVTWQNALGCRTKGVKEVTLVRAKELFPETPVTHATADALLLAEYGRRVSIGGLVPALAKESAAVRAVKAKRPDHVHRLTSQRRKLF